jgi:hypothetical protein
MSTLHLFWIASFAGAILFFVGGYFAGRARRPLVAETASSPSPSVFVPEVATRDYEGLVSRIAANTGAQCVALADEQGFTIAGRGENQDGLAALSGVLLESAAKAHKLVKLGNVRRINVESEAGTAINAYPVAVGGNEVILATLTVGGGPDENELRRALQAEKGAES